MSEDTPATKGAKGCHGRLTTGTPKRKKGLKNRGREGGCKGRTEGKEVPPTNTLAAL